MIRWRIGAFVPSLGRWSGVAVAAVLAALILSPSLHYPFGRDQGVFADVAGVILRGGVPYRDVWELKPPGVYYLYAVLLGVAGPSMAAIRAFDLLVQILVVVSLARLGGRGVGPIAVLLYATMYLATGHWSMAQAEGFSNLPVVAAILLARHGVDRGRTALVAGVLAGGAALLKITAALPCALVWTAVALSRGKDGRQRRSLLAFLVGVAVPLAGVALYLLAVGAWESYLEIQRGFVLPYSRLTWGGLSEGARAVADTRAFLKVEWVVWLLAIVGGVEVWKRRPRGETWGIALWLVGALVAVALQGKFFRYHWIPVLPPLALLAGVGLARLGGPLGRRGPAALILLVAAWAVFRTWPQHRDALHLVTGSVSRTAYLHRFGRPGQGDFSYLADEWLAGAIRRRTRPGESVFIWGFEPLVYVLSEREPPTRFHFAVPLVSPWAPAAWRDELMRDLEARPPELFVVARNDAIPWASGRADDSWRQLEAFPALRAFLRDGYRREGVVEDFTLFRRSKRMKP